MFGVILDIYILLCYHKYDGFFDIFGRYLLCLPCFFMGPEMT